MRRVDGRLAEELREVKITRNYLNHAKGSVLIEAGETKVICSVTVEEKVPPFLRDTATGWLTAEYAMLPASAQNRVPRDISLGRPKGRNQEIQRLIGRSLRMALDLENIGEMTIRVDCDVIEADGGTRTVSITGAWVAMYDAAREMAKEGIIQTNIIKNQVAAVSVGIVEDQLLLDLSYEEDSRAQVDTNVVMTPSGEIIEIQSTAEKQPFSQDELDKMLTLAKKGIAQLASVQKRTLQIK